MNSKIIVSTHSGAPASEPPLTLEPATLRLLLASTLDLAIQLEVALGQSCPPAPPEPASPAVKAEFAGAPDRLHLPSDWPRVGGRSFTPKRTLAFTTQEFQAAWRPGLQRAIYVAGCGGLSALAQKVLMPIYKVSTCGVDRVWDRIDELRRDAYGAVYHAGCGYAVEAGWDNWFPSHLRVQSLPSPNSPIRCGDRSLIVDLPAGMSCDEFDRAFDAEIRKGAVDLWSMTDEGRNHCKTLGLDSAVLRRFTEYPGGTDVRRSPAMELMAFNPLWGNYGDRLAAIAEQIILAHVGLGIETGSPTV